MRKTASEVIRELEIRVAHLEKQSIFGLFKEKKEKKEKRVTIASEEKLIERFIKGVRGVSDVSVDLSKRDKITMDILFHGMSFHWEGECNQDMEKIYGGSKTANPAAWLLMTQGGRSRSRSRGRSRHVGNTYTFRYNGRWDDSSIYVFTQFGELYGEGGNQKRIYETLKGLVSEKIEEREREEELRVQREEQRVQREEQRRQREERLERERLKEEEMDKARERNRQITRDRLERKRKKREEYEANRARNEERRRNR